MKMLITFFAFLISILCAGCIGGGEDSSSRVGNTNKMLSNIIVDEEKVFADIKFGISKEVFYNKVHEFQRPSDPKSDFDERSIGTYRYSYVLGTFDSNKLYMVVFYGNPIQIASYDTELRDQVNALKKILLDKYGEPDTNEGPPVGMQFEKRVSSIAYSWNIGKKSIEILITNHNDGYSVDLHIKLPDFQQKIMQTKTIEKQKRPTDVL